MLFTINKLIYCSGNEQQNNITLLSLESGRIELNIVLLCHKLLQGYLLLPCCFVTLLHAQEEFITSSGKINNHLSIQNTYRWHHHSESQVGDYPDTLNFILDTGSGGISLDSHDS